MSMMLGVLAAVMLSAASPEMVNQADWAQQKIEIDLPNGQRLAYVDYGDPAGAPVILLHGFTDTSRSWTQVLPFLSEYRVILIDQRGHGDASKPECCYAFANFAYDLKLLMDQLELRRASVAGHSLGSFIALEFAATYPERVDRLVLAGSTGRPAVAYGDWLANGALALQEPLEYDEGFLAEWISGQAAQGVDENFLAHVNMEIRQTPVAVWRGVIRALVGVPVARFANDVNAPVLILAGGSDDLFGAAHQAELRNALPKAEYRTFPGLGHNLIWEQPNLVGPALERFLSR